MVIAGVFVLSSSRRHTRCALVTGVQTCALPISVDLPPQLLDELAQVAIAHVGRDHHAPLAILAADLVGADRDLDRGNLAQRATGRPRPLRSTRAGQVAPLLRHRTRPAGKSTPHLEPTPRTAPDQGHPPADPP